MKQLSISSPPHPLATTVLLSFSMSLTLGISYKWNHTGFISRGARTFRFTHVVACEGRGMPRAAPRFRLEFLVHGDAIYGDWGLWRGSRLGRGLRWKEAREFSTGHIQW